MPPLLTATPAVAEHMRCQLRLRWPKQHQHGTCNWSLYVERLFTLHCQRSWLTWLTCFAVALLAAAVAAPVALTAEATARGTWNELEPAAATLLDASLLLLVVLLLLLVLVLVLEAVPGVAPAPVTVLRLS